MIKSARLSGLMVLAVILFTALDMTNASWAATARVAAAGNHSVTLKTDGTLWGWGENNFGQVGDGSQISRNAPVRIGTGTDWTNVAAGYYHTVALKADGSLWTWGDNTKGQLGDNLSAASRSVPVKIGSDTNWAAIAAGDFHTLALKTDGTLWAWGDNSSGQVGSGAVVPGIQPVPVKIGTGTDWSSVAAGGTHSVARKTNNTLWGWGSNSAGQLGNGTALDAVAPVQTKLLPPFVNDNWSAVAAGQTHSAALKTDGSLWSWGSNASGRLGNGTILNSGVPVRESGNSTDWVAVAAGDNHTMGLKANGTLWSWGGNVNGQLGNGTNLDALAPVKIVADTDWIVATAGSTHSVALKVNGTVWSWGGNSSGQLGDGTISSKNVPVLSAAAPATGVTLTASPASTQLVGNIVTFTAIGQGSTAYEYEFWLWSGTAWSKVQNYSAADTWIMPDTTPVGEYTIQVNVRGAGTAAESDAAARVTGYRITSAAATGVTLTATPANTQTFGSTASFKAVGQGSTGYEYEFWLWDGASWSLKQAYSPVDTWAMPATTPIGLYTIQVNVRGAGTTVESDATARIINYRVSAPAASGVTLNATPAISQTAGSTVSFQAAGQGSTGYEYEFWLWDGSFWDLKQAYSPVDTWIMPITTPAGLYTIQVNVRAAGSTVESDAVARIVNYLLTP